MTPRRPERRHEHRTHPLSRRTFLAAGAAAGLGAVLPWGTGPVASARPTAMASRHLVGDFAAPPRAAQGRFRWWWPHGLVDSAEIAREIDQIADAGFGGVEIADVHHSVADPLDPAGHGWGTPAWTAAVEAALVRAKERGVVVDLTIGPAWPAAVPTVDPQSDGAMTELAHGLATVAPGTTFDGPLPEPEVEPAAGVTARSLVAVHVVRVAADASVTDSPIAIDLDTVTDITSAVTDEHLIWTAPADDGTWLVVPYWQRGSGQRPERGPHSEPISYVVDHFGATGTQAVIDFWENHILTPSIRGLLRDCGGAMFEDSIEMETDATLWTADMPAEFERRTGYPLRPLLPLVVEQDEDPVFTADGVTDRRVRDDYNAVLGELYIDHHLRPLQRWLQDLGLQLRVQPYGLETDAVTKSAIVDVAEGETLGFSNLDDFRSLAGGRDLGGKTVLSSEAAAAFGASYSMTWKRAARVVAREYAAGVNQAVLHGFSYADAPGARWPGFGAFTPYDGGVGYSESWGPRSPLWRHAPDVAGFFARSQFVLQTGVATTDVAFLRQKGYAGTGFGAAYFSAEGIRLGWSHQFVSPGLLELTDPVVENGRLAPDGPGYRLLVFEGDAFNGRVTTLPVETARRLLGYARAGLRIIVVGDWTTPEVPGMPAPGENAELAGLVHDLLAEPTVVRVDDRDGIGSAVAAGGVEPTVRYGVASDLLHMRRATDDAEFLYLVNSSDTDAVDHDVTISSGIAEPTPFALDPWTGTVRRMTVFDRGAGWVRVRIRLQPGAATIVAVAAPHWLDDGGPPERHVVRTDADETATVDGTPVVRSNRAGVVTSVYTGGRVAPTRIRSVGPSIDLDHWHLRVEDWRPGNTATETAIQHHGIDLPALVPWSEIPALADVSGIGRYSTTVTLGGAWTGGHGARLHLGETTDTFRVTVNGHPLPPADPFHPVVDVGAQLHEGENTIEVEIATTLINRLRVDQPEVYGSVQRQPYGLTGPVRLVPYGQAPLRPPTVR